MSTAATNTTTIKATNCHPSSDIEAQGENTVKQSAAEVLARILASIDTLNQIPQSAWQAILKNAGLGSYSEEDCQTIRSGCTEHLNQTWLLGLTIVRQAVGQFVELLNQVQDIVELGDFSKLPELKQKGLDIVDFTKSEELAARSLDACAALSQELADFQDLAGQLRLKRFHGPLSLQITQQGCASFTKINDAATLTELLVGPLISYTRLLRSAVDLEQQVTSESLNLGIDPNKAAELLKKHQLEHVKECLNYARQNGLSTENAYQILIRDTQEAFDLNSYKQLIDGIARFGASLSPLESRVKYLCANSKPELFCSHEQLKGAENRLNQMRQSENNPLVAASLTKLLLAYEVICELLKSEIESYDRRSHAAMILAFSFSHKEYNGSAQKTKPARAAFNQAIKTKKLLGEVSVSIQLHWGTLATACADLYKLKILRTGTLPKTNKNLEVRILDTTDLSLASDRSTASPLASRIADLLKSIDLSEEQFLATLNLVTGESHLGSSKQARGTKKNRPAGSPDTLLGNIEECLNQSLSATKSHLLKSLTDRLATHLQSLKSYLEQADTQLPDANRDTARALIGLLKPNQILTAEQIPDRLDNLRKLKQILAEKKPEITLSGLPFSANHESVKTNNGVSLSVPIFDPPRYSTANRSIDESNSLPLKVAIYIHSYRLLEAILKGNNRRPIAYSQNALLNIAEQLKVALGTKLDRNSEILINDNWIKVVEPLSRDGRSDDEINEIESTLHSELHSDRPIVFAYRNRSTEQLASRLPDKGQHDRYKATLGDVNLTIAQDLLTIEEAIRALLSIREDDLLGVIVTDAGAVVRSAVPLSKRAFELIKRTLALYEFPIYIDTPTELAIKPKGYQIKKFIKMSLPENSRLTDFQSENSDSHFQVKIATTRHEEKEIKSDLNTLRSQLEKLGCQLGFTIINIHTSLEKCFSELAPPIRRACFKASKGTQIVEVPKINKSPNITSSLPITLEEAYSQLTGAQRYEDGDIFSIDPGGGLAEDAISYYQDESTTKIGVHVVNGAFLAPPASINRATAYLRGSSVYSANGEVFAMMPRLRQSGFKPGTYVPALSLFIENTTEPNTKQYFSISTLKLSFKPTLIRIKKKGVLTPDENSIEDSASIAQSVDAIRAFCNDLSGTVLAPGYSKEQVLNLSDCVRILLQLFNHQAAAQVQEHLPLIFSHSTKLNEVPISQLKRALQRQLRDRRSLKTATPSEIKDSPELTTQLVNEYWRMPLSERSKLNFRPPMKQHSTQRGLWNYETGRHSYVALNRALRDMSALVGQHQIMASLGFWPALNRHQVDEILHREKAHHRHFSKLKKDLDVINEIRMLKKSKYPAELLEGSNELKLSGGDSMRIKSQCFLDIAQSHQSLDEIRGYSLLVQFSHFDLRTGSHYLRPTTPD